MDRNGLQTFIMNVYRKIDRTKVQFDFIEFRHDRCEYDEEIESMGGKIYRLPSKSSDLFACLNGIRKIVKENNYSVVHRHYYSSTMVIELLAAKVGGAQTLISHSHSTKALHRSYLHYLFRPLLNRVANMKFACSEEAGIWMYGRHDFTTIRNGIDVQKYLYNSSRRETFRKQLGLTNEYVIGNVARFDTVKNHAYMIKIIEHYVNEIDKNAKLVLIGTGTQYNLIKEQINKMSLNNNVLFLGSKDNVSDYIQIFDVFILPSLYEGIPLTLIEAQANGLFCLVSDRVDKKADVTNNVRYIDIDDKSIGKWCAEINKVRNIAIRDNNAPRKIEEHGYSSDVIAKDLLTYYERCKFI